MRLNMFLFPTLFALAGLVPAQIECVRGEVTLNNTDNVFYLRHTGWALAFDSATIPDNWVGKPLTMKIANFGTAIAPELKVTSAELTNQVLTIGTMVAGSEASGSVAARPGSFVSVCFEEPAHMIWAPIPGMGVWMLEQSLCGYVEGFASDATGVFEFRFDVPNLDVLAGRVYLAQAMVYDLEKVWLSNLDGGPVLSK
jgi:hypothetical protein